MMHGRILADVAKMREIVTYGPGDGKVSCELFHLKGGAKDEEIYFVERSQKRRTCGSRE